jgi:hypothetical protein
MKRAPFASSLVLAALLALPVGPVASASAQEPGASSERSSGRKKAKRSKRGKRAKKEEAPAAAEAKPSTDKEAAVPAGESVAPPTGDKASGASSALGDGEEQVRKEGDTDVKTVEFTGLDIEGQLKTPQLLYFLTRLRAEFDRPRLPHRSFMPELSRTSGEKSLR